MQSYDGFLLAGKDRSVVLWSIQDHISSLSTDTASGKSPSSGANSKQSSKVTGTNEKPADSPSIDPRGVFQGHDATVEDVTFCPSRYLLLHGILRHLSLFS